MNRAFAAVIVSLLAVSALAQGGSKSVVSVSTTGPTEPVAAGYSFQVAVVLQVKSGFHINAQKPSEDYLIGTKLSLTPPPGMKVSKVSYPRAKMATFEFSETPLAVYDGTVEVMATIKTEKSLDAGTREITGKITFQACNDQSCLAPSTVDVTASVNIVEPEEQATGSLSITGAPPEAHVSIDGRQVGRTDANGRLLARDVEVGRRRVRVEAEGLSPFERSVTVEPEKSVTVDAALAAVAPPPDTSSPEPTAQAAAPVVETPPAPPPAPPAETAPVRFSPVQLALIGAVVGSAIAAVFVVARRRAMSRPSAQPK
jgi:hypothetical protein